MLVLASFFVIGTVLFSRGEKAWKASILPAVFHGIRGLSDDDYLRLTEPVAMRREAEKLVVGLDDWDGGLRWRARNDGRLHDGT